MPDQKDRIATHQDAAADQWSHWRASLTPAQRRNVCDYSLSRCNCNRLHYK